MQFYIVGGYVRDRLMGLEPKDMDFVVVGATAEEMLALGYKQVGADFPVFLHPVTGDEYALARIERKNGHGYHGFDTVFGNDITLEQDLSRRDLAMNAMAHPVNLITDQGVPMFDWDDENVIDPFGGMNDLSCGTVRHIGAPFRDDPVRIFRAARFAARYHFVVHSDTMELMQHMVQSGELRYLPMERIWAEVRKGLMGPRPDRFFSLLGTAGAFWDELEGYAGGIKGQGLWRCTAEQLKNVPLHVRFAVISFVFSKDAAMYDRCCIPHDAKQLALVAHNNHDEATYYHKMTAENQLVLLRKVGAIGGARKTDLFKNFLFVHKLWCTERFLDSNWKIGYVRMQEHATLLAAQDMAAVVANAPDPKTVPEFINQFYTNLMETNV